MDSFALTCTFYYIKTLQRVDNKKLFKLFQLYPVRIARGGVKTYKTGAREGNIYGRLLSD
jgi:hypothetical protein